MRVSDVYGEKLSYTPTGRTWRIFLIITSLLVFLAFLVLVITKPISQDEGVFLTIGKYINQGLIPYRDLVDHKPPAIYFLFASLFKLFGTNVWVIKIALILSTLGTGVFVKKITDHLKSGAGWYAAIIFVFLLTQFEGYYLIAEPFMILPLLLAWWLIVRRPHSSGWLVVAGACLGLVILFKQTGLLSVISLLILGFTRTSKRVMLLLGFFLPLLLTLLYLKANGAVGAAWHQVVILTLTHYPPESLSYVLKTLSWNFLWTFPMWVLLVVGFKAQLQNRKMIWSMIVLPLPFMVVRHYPHYWVQVLPFVAIIAATALIHLRSAHLKVAMLIFCVAIASGKVGQDALPNYSKLQTQFKTAEILNADASLRRDDGSTLLLAENQFTGFYFLLPLRPLNKFLFITEITDADGAQQKTIDDLPRNPGTLILWPDPSRAYAQSSQEFIYTSTKPTKKFPTLEMRTFVSQ